MRDVRMLRSLAVHLMTQTASLVSLKRLAGIFEVSLDLVRTYCGYLEEAFLFSFAEHYSLKTAERLRQPVGRKADVRDPPEGVEVVALWHLLLGIGEP